MTLKYEQENNGLYGTDSEYWYEWIFNRWKIVKIYLNNFTALSRLKKGNELLGTVWRMFNNHFLREKCKHGHLADCILLELVRTDFNFLERKQKKVEK